MSTNETFLITGAMGCIGAWTLHHLVKEGAKPVSFDLSDNRHRLNLLLPPEEQSAITFVQGDLTDTPLVQKTFEDHGITHVVHLAALQVPFCAANPPLGARVNVVGTINIFEAARLTGLKHIAYASSIAVYGAADEYPPGAVRHDAPMLPHTLYGVYKQANEGSAKVYWQDHRISSTNLRAYTVYGVGRDQGLTSDPTKAMLSAVAGKPFNIKFGGKMQFQLASDVAKQFIAAARKPLNGAYGFNLGTEPATINNVVEIIRSLKPDAKITHDDKQLPFPQSFDDTELHRHFDTVYETKLTDGIRQTMEHFEQSLSLGLVQPPTE